MPLFSLRNTKKLPPYLKDSKRDIICWGEKEEPGEEQVFSPCKRVSHAPDSENSHPWSYAPLKKPDPAAGISRDIITFRPFTTKHYDGEVHYEIPMKKCTKLQNRMSLIVEDRFINEVNQNTGEQVGALMGIQRHVDHINDRESKKPKKYSYPLSNVETGQKTWRIRSMPLPYQTWYEISMKRLKHAHNSNINDTTF